MKNPDGVGKVGNPVCGDVMELFIKVGKNKQGKKFVKDISFLTYGCAAAIATSSMLTDLVKGKTLEEALKITDKDIAKKLEGLPQIKMHCSVLASEAFQKAVEDYESKQKK
jgi:nitrogen fixation NifU-like protein